MKKWSIAVVAALLPLALGACSQSETRDESGAIVTGGATDVFTIAVGDCFNDTETSAEAEEVESVPTVPCSEPHDNEVYAEYTFPAGDYPGVATVEETAMDECYNEWEGFVGTAYEESVLDFYPIYPTSESWNRLDDRLVTCVAYDPSAQVTGTLEGAAR